MILDFIRLYDSIPLEQAEARLYFPGTTGVTTTLNASDTCRIDRDELGWLHVQLGRKVDDKVEWRAKAIILPPSAVRFAESASASMPSRMEPPAWGTAPDARAMEVAAAHQGQLNPQIQDTGYRHPKAKKR